MVLLLFLEKFTLSLDKNILFLFRGDTPLIFDYTPERKKTLIKLTLTMFKIIFYAA